LPVSFGGANAEHHSIGVHVLGSQVANVDATESAGVHGSKDDLQMGRHGGVNELPASLGYQDHWERVGLGETDCLQSGPVARNGHAKEEFQCSDDRPHRTELQLLSSQQDILPDLCFGEFFRGASEVLSQVGDGIAVAGDGAGLLSAEQQVFSKPLGEVRVKASERGLFLKSSSSS